jgi:2-oxoglutarate dehydrogenase E2 component (dihydrolipoamide succinyltransferase)
MAQYELILPKMGESVAEATLIKWVKKPGEMIRVDESVLEIATDKVDSEVPSPVAGKLVRTLFNEDEVVQVGAVIAIIETEINEFAEEPKTSSLSPQTGSQEASKSEDQKIPGIDQITERSAQTNYSTTSRFYSPLVKSIAAEENIPLSQLDTIKGTGAEGRVTKQDLLNFITHRSSSAGADVTIASKPAEQSQLKEQIKNPVASAGSVSGGDEIIEMDRMRRLIAEHMVMSKHTSPHVTSFVEADVTNLVKWRDRVKNAFEKREGEKITFTPIFIEAVAKAIKDLPMINVSVNSTQIIKKRDINIGMAAALPSGNLIVPVIKNADQLNLVGLTKSVNDLANRARQSKLKPDETQSGTFTITNVGSFGNVMGTPIINQPQVAILAVGAIKKKPAVIETEYGDVIAIRHMMFLSLSYDHRVVDGALGGSFVRKVADYLEAWDMNREI